MMIRTESVWPLVIMMMIQIVVQVASVAVQLAGLYEGYVLYGSSGVYTKMALRLIFNINYAMFPVAVILILWPGRRRPTNVVAVHEN